MSNKSILQYINYPRFIFSVHSDEFESFVCVFLQMYFNASISSTTKLLKPLLVFAFCMAAGLAGLTQITQHRSHPIDVYAGYLIGAGIGVYLVSRINVSLTSMLAL